MLFWKSRYVDFLGFSIVIEICISIHNLRSRLDTLSSHLWWSDLFVFKLGCIHIWLQLAWIDGIHFPIYAGWALIVILTDLWSFSLLHFLDCYMRSICQLIVELNLRTTQRVFLNLKEIDRNRICPVTLPQHDISIQHASSFWCSSCGGKLRHLNLAGPNLEIVVIEGGFVRDWGWRGHGASRKSSRIILKRIRKLEWRHLSLI